MPSKVETDLIKRYGVGEVIAAYQGMRLHEIQERNMGVAIFTGREAPAQRKLLTVRGTVDECLAWIDGYYAALDAVHAIRQTATQKIIALRRGV